LGEFAVRMGIRFGLSSDIVRSDRVQDDESNAFGSPKVKLRSAGDKRRCSLFYLNNIAPRTEN
jgi:hypothetical protein